jgi:alkylated DNA repair protein (DNA oxidative demethylase)
MSVSMVRVSEGAYHLPAFLDTDEQIRVARDCIAFGTERAGFYQPILRSGAKMRLRMICFGKHWNAKRYIYQPTREDVDGEPVPTLPVSLADLGRRVAASVNMPFQPDVALLNLYAADGKLGLHRDCDERPSTLRAGFPVVSLSLGDDALFAFGGTSRKDPVQKIRLASGDAFVFGGPSRLCYHGILRIFPGTVVTPLGFAGRLNITLRQY